MKAAAVVAVLVLLAVTTADMLGATGAMGRLLVFLALALRMPVAVAVPVVMAVPVAQVVLAAVVAAIPAERTAPQTRVVALVRLKQAGPASSFSSTPYPYSLS